MCICTPSAIPFGNKLFSCFFVDSPFVFFGFQLIFPRFWPKHCHHSSFPILLRLRLKNIQKNHVTCSMEIGFYNSIICYPNINVLVSSFQCVSDNGVFIYMYYRFPYVLLPLDILLVSKMFIIFGFY